MDERILNQMANPDPNGAKILVVDDEAEIRQLLQEVLTQEGYRVITAGDGREALPLTLNDAPDVIITDLRMPKLDGLTLCKALRLNKDTRHIPIIMLTTYDSPDSLQASLAAGADDFLPKPLNVEEIKLRVRNHLRFKRATEELNRLRQQ